MSIRSHLLAAAILGLSFAAAQPALADGQATSTANSSCFLASNWEGWKSPSPSVIYLRVRISDVYRLDLSAPSSSLQDGDVHLVSKIRGSDWVCNPLDLDLQLADEHGAFREPLFVKSITKLSPDEVKAIPAKFRP